MQITRLSEDAQGLVRVSCQGRITQDALASSQDPLEAVCGTDIYSHRILLDLGNADYMDSSGVSWLLKTHKRCREHGGLLVIHSTPPLIKQILKVLRMELVFHLAPDEKAAKELISRECRE